MKILQLTCLILTSSMLYSMDSDRVPKIIKLQKRTLSSQQLLMLINENKMSSIPQETYDELMATTTNDDRKTSLSNNCNVIVEYPFSWQKYYFSQVINFTYAGIAAATLIKCSNNSIPLLPTLCIGAGGGFATGCVLALPSTYNKSRIGSQTINRSLIIKPDNE